MTSSSHPHIAFIGGGNMASAIMGGLVHNGLPTAHLTIVEPHAPQRDKLCAQFAGSAVLPAASDALAACDVVVWATKPQTFKEAAQACAAHVRHALHLSVAAGIRSDSIAAWLGCERIVRAMPNTPALVGQGMTGLNARAAVSDADRAVIERIVTPTGDWVWVPQEADLDAVTALSGSGPAYVFYFLEAMREAGVGMGLDAATAERLAIGTFSGAAALAKDATDPPEVLRERVTSKGGTTYAALTAMEAAHIKASFVKAMQAAQQRAVALAQEFGK